MVTPDECLYCKNKEKLDSLMIYIADLGVTKLYLFKEQTYYGRCVIAYKDHGRELYDLTADEAAAFIADMQRAGMAINKAVTPAKVNYGMFSDTLPHLHVHIVPKQAGGYGVSRKKYEFDDLARIARETGLSLPELLEKLP